MIGLLLLGGCAGMPGPRPGEELLLRLTPASLGRTLGLRQHLVVTAAGRSQAVDVALEVDPQELRLAVLGMNQTMVRMVWDGQTLQQTRANWLPEVVRGERILSDLQLVWWPADEVRAALPQGWALETTDTQRRLLWKGQEVMRVDYRGNQHVDVFNWRAAYQLQIDSVEQSP